MNDYIRNAPQITYVAARLAMDAAIAKAQSIGVPQNISIVDAGGNLMAFARMDGARTLARHSSLSKARTAASLRNASGELPDAFGVDLALATGGESINLKGGLPIVFEGDVLGAIGVSSGADDEDIAVAQAGCEAILLAISSR
jgi:glc operon protein GlcG